jgi:hypothetical protein
MSHFALKVVGSSSGLQTLEFAKQSKQLVVLLVPVVRESRCLLCSGSGWQQRFVVLGTCKAEQAAGSLGSARCNGGKSRDIAVGDHRLLCGHQHVAGVLVGGGKQVCWYLLWCKSAGVFDSVWWRPMTIQINNILIYIV